MKNLIANRPTKKIKTMLRKISRKFINPKEWVFDRLEDVLDESEVLSVVFGGGGVFPFAGEGCWEDSCSGGFCVLVSALACDVDEADADSANFCSASYLARFSGSERTSKASFRSFICSCAHSALSGFKSGWYFLASAL